MHSHTPLKTKANEKQSFIIEKSMKIILTWFIVQHHRMTVTAVTVITFTPVIYEDVHFFLFRILSHNKLTKITRDSFKGLSNLTWM
jgi:hypothetical protein